ncbi:MAG: N-acetyltransferase [Pseudomonadota bacterium]
MADNRLRIRAEIAADQAVIHALTRTAFKDQPYADGDEQAVVDRLRDRGALTLSLVALAGDTLVGQVTFSPAQREDGSGPWFALGPVSVLPQRQSRGIGGALIRAGLEDLRERGALGCILTGNPAYYERFGFALAGAHAPANEPAEYFMVKLLGASALPATPISRFAFHPGFYG